MGPLLVTPEDHDAGFKDVALDYRRRPVPPGLPEIIRIRALSYVEAASIGSALQASSPVDGTDVPPGFDENVWRLSVLLAALPEPHNNTAFLNRLKPNCAGQLTIVALQLAYGTPDSDGSSGHDVKKNLIGSEVSAPA